MQSLSCVRFNETYECPVIFQQLIIISFRFQSPPVPCPFLDQIQQPRASFIGFRNFDVTLWEKNSNNNQNLMTRNNHKNEVELCI